MHTFQIRPIGIATVAVILFIVGLFFIDLLQPAVLAEPGRKSATAAKSMKSEPIAVVELFTSEGCSSCPPADVNLARIAKSEAAEGRKVFPLSFHVDYWNRLGWKDPFSQAAFTARQQEYAAALGTDNIYTPQMIVNGTTEFVGSNQKQSDQAIREALRRPAKHNVKLTSGTVKDGQIPVRYQVSGPVEATADGPRYVVNLAIVTDSESVSVPRGENSGRKLSHVWVVKGFKSVPLNSEEGLQTLDAAMVKSNRSRVIVYIQDRETREITGAAAIDQ